MSLVLNNANKMRLKNRMPVKSASTDYTALWWVVFQYFTYLCMYIVYSTCLNFSNVISQRNEEQLQQRGQQQQPLASASIVAARTQEVEDCSSVESTSFRIGTKKCSRPEPRRNHLPPPPASPLSLSPPAADEHTTADDVITINVSGNRFQVFLPIVAFTYFYPHTTDCII